MEGASEVGYVENESPSNDPVAGDNSSKLAGPRGSVSSPRCGRRSGSTGTGGNRQGAPLLAMQAFASACGFSFASLVVDLEN